MKALPSHIVVKAIRIRLTQAKYFKARVWAGVNKQVYQRSYNNLCALVIDFKRYLV